MKKCGPSKRIINISEKLSNCRNLDPKVDVFCYGCIFLSRLLMNLIPSIHQISVSGPSFLAGIRFICILSPKWRPYENGFENAIFNIKKMCSPLKKVFPIAFSKPFWCGLHFDARIHMELIPARNESPDTEIWFVEGIRIINTRERKLYP